MRKIFNSRYPMVVHINETRQHEDLYIREAGWSCPPAGHRQSHILPPNYAIHFVTRGCGYLSGQRIEAPCGFLLAKNEPYSYVFDDVDPWEHYWICVDGIRAPGVLTSMGMLPHNHVFACDYFDDLRADFDRVLAEAELDAEYPVYMMGMFYRIMAFHAKRSNIREQSDRAERYCLVAAQYIHDNYFHRITVEDVAAAATITSKYLYKLFSEKFGMPPTVYIANYRMERACHLLTDTELPVSEIAHAVGFEQPGYFSNTFRRHFGISPGHYREKNRSPRSD